MAPHPLLPTPSAPICDLDSTRVQVQWNAARFMLAASHVEYYSLSGGGITPDEWKICCGRDLLTPREIETLKAYKG